MTPRRRKTYSREFKVEAVRMAMQEGVSMSQVARDLGVPDSCMSRWVHQAEVDRGEGELEELTTAEKEELRRLRRETARLKMEVEILKKAAAFFAKESL